MQGNAMLLRSFESCLLRQWLYSCCDYVGDCGSLRGAQNDKHEAIASTTPQRKGTSLAATDPSRAREGIASGYPLSCRLFDPAFVMVHQAPPVGQPGQPRCFTATVMLAQAAQRRCNVVPVSRQNDAVWDMIGFHIACLCSESSSCR